MKVLEPEQLKQGLIHINQLQVSLQEKFDNAYGCVPQMSGRNIPILFLILDFRLVHSGPWPFD